MALHIFKKLRPDHWAWLHAKLALMTWAIIFYFNTPPQVEGVLDRILATLISVFVVSGLLLSVTGLLLAVSKKTRRSGLGTSLEISGLWIALAGPVSYFIVRFYLAFTPDGKAGSALAALAYTVCAFVIVRLVQVIHFRKKVSS